MKEHWKMIEGFDNYQISDQGRVKNIYTGRVLKNYAMKDGRKCVNLRKDGKKIFKLVHRLVAEAFISEDASNYDVKHIDGDRNNNCVDNLVLSGIKNSGRNKRVMVVETGKVYYSIKECGRDTGIKENNIRRALKGEYCVNKLGYHFKYVD